MIMEYKIDMDRIRKALPDRAKVKPIKYKGKSPALEIECWPSLDEKDYAMVIDWLRDIIGKDNILEFYTEQTGGHWYVFLKREPFEMENATDEDINSFINMELVRDGEIVGKL